MCSVKALLQALSWSSIVTLLQLQGPWRPCSTNEVGYFVH